MNSRAFALFMTVLVALIGLPCRSQVLTDMEPATGKAGDSFSAVIQCEVEYSFALPATITFSPAGEISASEVDLLDTDQLQARISIPENTACGWQDLSVTTSLGTFLGEKLFEVECQTTPEPRLVSVAPSAAFAGDIVSVKVTGADTHFAEGQSQLSFSEAEITADNVAVTGPTSLTARLSIAASATPQLVDVTVATGSEEVTGKSLFRIEAPPLLLHPASGSQGDSLNVVISGGSYQYSASTTVSLGVGITIGQVKIEDEGSSLILVDVSIAVNAPVGFHNMVVGTPAVTVTNAFTVIQGPDTKLLSVSPNHGDLGHPGLSLLLQGQNTHFDYADVTASLSTAGTSILLENVLSATEMEASLGIGATAKLGPADISVSLGLGQGCENCESVLLNDGFELTAPGVLAYDGPQLAPGQTTELTISAVDGGFDSAQTVLLIEPEDGIEVVSLTVQDENHLTASLHISVDADGNPRDAKTVTDTEVAMGTGIIDVLQPAFEGIVPAFGLQGAALTLLINTVDLDLDAASQVSFSGAGMTLAAPIYDPSLPDQITVSATIADDAPLGTRDLTLRTAAQEIAAPAVFQIRKASAADEGCSCTHTPSHTGTALLGLMLLAIYFFRGNRW